MKGSNAMNTKELTRDYINGAIRTIDVLNILIDNGYGYKEFIRIYKIREYFMYRVGFSARVAKQMELMR